MLQSWLIQVAAVAAAAASKLEDTNLNSKAEAIAANLLEEDAA